MSASELCYLSASQAIQGFTDRSLSPVELMQALAERCESVEAQINAFTESWFDETG